MQVLKFGGTSVGTAQAIQQVISISLEAVKKEPTIIVCSAMSGITDQLINLANLAAKSDISYKNILHKIEEKHFNAIKILFDIKNQSSILSCIKQQINEIENICEGIFLLQELSVRSLDRIVSYGEILSTKIIAANIKFLYPNSTWLDSRTFIKTDNQYGAAKVDYEHTTTLMQAYFNKNEFELYIVPGFIASTKDNITTTLGRGGSDLTGAIYAKCLQASVLEIWTDVSGMMTADPRIVQNVKPIQKISYQEALELSHFGAKIIYPPTIQPVMSLNIPVWIKNTFAPNDEGTLIENVGSNNDNIIRGISSVKDISLLNLEGPAMLGIPGFSKRLFDCLANEHINVILITQSSSEYSICVAIHKKDVKKAKIKIDHEFHSEIKENKLNPLSVENNLAIIALVGEKMKSHPGICGKLFGALGKNGINVRAIAQGSTEKNISTVISEEDVNKAVNVLHEAFFESTKKQLNVYITGVGNVGSKLLEQIKQQEEYLNKNQNLQINIVGLANSKKVLFNDKGIDLLTWKEKLLHSEDNNIDYFVQEIIHKNLRNAVFVDITANAAVASVYSKLLEKSIAVVACNKIACSRNYAEYIHLKNLCHEFNTSFLFETNVGAGLPIIGTLNDLLKSGDKIRSIKAVLSGTLNFVFNNYDTTIPFASVVKQAQDEGFTEPDPRLDLGGTDVMRKILILARESGQHIEIDEISNNGFLPPSCMEGSVDDFYKELLVHENHFKKLYEVAKNNHCKLKFVATFEHNTAKVQLEHIPTDSPFYHLYGKDNLVLFFTKRYYDQPLVIKGAGAGADVTASGIFADIIRAVKI